MNRPLELEARAIELRRRDEERVQLAADLRRIDLAARVGADRDASTSASSTTATGLLGAWTGREEQEDAHHPEDALHRAES